MWDCKYRKLDDSCLRRKAGCFVGGVGCVLKGKYEFPFRTQEDPLLLKRKMLTAYKTKERLQKNKKI